MKQGDHKKDICFYKFLPSLLQKLKSERHILMKNKNYYKKMYAMDRIIKYMKGELANIKEEILQLERE